MGYSPQGLKELDTEQQLSMHAHTHNCHVISIMHVTHREAEREGLSLSHTVELSPSASWQVGGVLC